MRFSDTGPSWKWSSSNHLQRTFSDCVARVIYLRPIDQRRLTLKNGPLWITKRFDATVTLWALYKCFYIGLYGIRQKKLISTIAHHKYKIKLQTFAIVNFLICIAWHFSLVPKSFQCVNTYTHTHTPTHLHRSTRLHIRMWVKRKMVIDPSVYPHVPPQLPVVRFNKTPTTPPPPNLPLYPLLLVPFKSPYPGHAVWLI